MPAEAGIALWWRCGWMDGGSPAFAGMTAKRERGGCSLRSIDNPGPWAIRFAAQPGASQIMTTDIDPRPLLEVAVGLAILTVIITLHGAGLRSIYRAFSRRWVAISAQGSYWRINMTLAAAVAAMAVLHLLETMVWALPIWLGGLFPNLRDSYFYVLEAYTTLGEGTVTLPPQWRLIGPIIAMSGLFTFGWTGSVLVNIMNEFGKLDKSEAKNEQHRN
jgi:hypothetical protein